MTTIAVLDDKMHLIGLKKLTGKQKPKKGDVVVADECDLPLDGSFRWISMEECFMHKEHGYGKPPPAPISRDRVLYLLARKVKNPDAELETWIKWYEGITHVTD